MTNLIGSRPKAYSVDDLPEDVARELIEALDATIAELEEQAMQPNETAALERLIKIAHGDTTQSRRVADFLLGWWNTTDCGAFDLTTLWGLDTPIIEDMTTVFGAIARAGCYPDALGYEADFQRIVEQWRPELLDPR